MVLRCVATGALVLWCDAGVLLVRCWFASVLTLLCVGALVRSCVDALTLVEREREARGNVQFALSHKETTRS